MKFARVPATKVSCYMGKNFKRMKIFYHDSRNSDIHDYECYRDSGFVEYINS